MPRLTVAVVPARAGSKGFPKKNFAEIGDVPLYLLAVRQASRTCDLTILTTDIEERTLSTLPKDTVVHRRSAINSTDHAPMSSVLEEVIKAFRLNDVDIVLLQPTSPLRIDADIKDSIDVFASMEFDIVMSVNETSNTILKCGTLSDGYFSAIRANSDCFQNRQVLPKVYKPNGAVYVFNSSWFKSNHYSLNAGKIGASIMPRERSLDIDTENDYKNILGNIAAKVEK
ncbi:MAG: acylneuraminate cytidylyltransferase family protein [Burkholderiaceae bacterium]|nr:acylneuraminate cytidylyltransferase family protein [Burkholderiaceae bacterium]